MGYYTWKDCQDRRRSVGYDKPVFVICPDDTVIREPSYSGYGIFGGHDIFDLVVDWNRPFLKEIFEKKGSDAWGANLMPIAIAAMENDAGAGRLAEEIWDKLPGHICGSPDEWKRNIGISIACEDMDNENLPFPIKMSAAEPRKTYKELPPSFQYQ